MAKVKKANKIPEHVAEKVLLLDCSDEKDIRRLHKSLMKLPFIKSKSDLETDRLEEILKKLERRYKFSLAYVNRGYLESRKTYIYSGMVKNDKGEWIVTASALSFNEVLAKVLFYMYFFVTCDKKVRDELIERRNGS